MLKIANDSNNSIYSNESDRKYNNLSEKSSNSFVIEFELPIENDQ